VSRRLLDVRPHLKWRAALNVSTGVGTLFTAFGNIFFALVQDGWSYWAYGFPSAIIVVFGADFVFSSGSLFLAKCARPHEQSVAGALFSVMTQVMSLFLPLFLFSLLPLS